MSKFVAALPLALLAAAPAWSLTAPELWEDWQELGARMNMTLQADSEDYTGGTLVLEGLRAEIDTGGGNADTSYGTITLVEQDDGSVRIELPGVIDVTSTSEIEGTTVTVPAEMRHEGLSILARDEGDQRIYDIRADSIVYELSDLTGGQETNPVSAVMSLSGVASRYASDLEGETIGLTQTYDADSLEFAVSATGEAAFDMTYGMTSMTGGIEGAYPSEPAPAGGNIFAAMGITYEGGITHSGSTLSFVGMAPEGETRVAGSSASGGIELGLTQEAIEYVLTSQGAEMTVVPPALPLPIRVTMAEARTGLTFPFAVSDGGSPYALDIAYRDLALDEQLWALFDPTGQLPRDPATLEISLAGDAKVTADVLGDPEAMAGLQGPPILPETLDLTTLRLSVAGAELTGSGALTFPEAGPLPQPVGKLNLALEGGMQLLDKLVAMGLVPAQQATFLRGMAGVVAKPVSETRLESEIEFTENGGILANGLPLQ